VAGAASSGGIFAYFQVDVAGLSRPEASKNMRWAAQSLLEATLARAAARAS